MKKTLLLFSLCAAMLGLKANAQTQPYTLNVFDDAVYYNMYQAELVDEPVPDGAIRHTNSSYGKMLTEEQLNSFGNTLTMTVTLRPRCDNYDRIGKVNLAFVPKGQTSYVYNDVNVKRIEVGRFITPFMRPDVVAEVPYTFNVDNLTQIFHDEAITSVYDLWVELEVYGYQGGPGQGGAAVEYPAMCSTRNDVYSGSLDFTSTTNSQLELGENHFTPIITYFELKKYEYPAHTDVEGETTKSVTFTLDEAVPNAKLYLITSNHGSNANGEEYIRREHFVYFNGELKHSYIPGGVSCWPYRQYNTQGNCIYNICYSNGTSVPRPNTNAAWSWNNWCPGDKVPTRVIELGDLAAGEHTFKIDVPDAEFAGNQGYFPMSVYLQGYSQTLGTENFKTSAFSVTPNPVNDIATISVNGQEVKSVSVVNTLGQTVLQGGSSKQIDLSSLQQGIYIVKVQFEDNTTGTQKVVKKII